MSGGTRRALLVGTALSISWAASAAEKAQAQGQNEVIALDVITIEAVKKAVADIRLAIATTVLGAEALPPASPDPVADIARQVPGTSFTDFGRFGESYLTMRGIATLGAPLNPLDATVGFSIDEAPVSLSGLGLPLLDVDRVEVLRGPQGTTFGRNAAGGSINVFSTPTDGARELRLDAEAGSGGHAFAQLTAGGWLVPETLAGRGTVRWQQFDGDIPNAIIGGTEGGSEIGAARAALRLTPGGGLTVDLSGTYSRDERDTPAFILDGYEDFPASGTDIHPDSERAVAAGQARISKVLDSVTLTSLTSYQDIRIDNLGDFTDTLFLNAALGLPPLFPNPVLTSPLIDKYISDEHERVFSQEFRINANEGADWDWVAGVNYFRSEYNYRSDVSSTAWPVPGGTKDNDILSQTVAVFGDLTVPLGQRWEVSGGLRLAHDEQELDGLYVNDRPTSPTAFPPPTVPFGSSFSQSGETSDTYATGRAALSYFWSEEAMAYASVARGYSSGGFEKQTLNAPYAVAAEPFAPAIVWTYEIGAKAEIADGVRLSGAAFYNDVADGQVAYYDAAYQTRLANQDYRSYGAEAGVAARLMEGLDLLASVTVMTSEQGAASAESAAAGAAEGNAVPQIPSFAASIGAEYRVGVPVGALDGDLVLRGEYQYVGERFSDLANLQRLDPYHIVNARIGWEGGHLSLYAFGRNLLDERPEQFAQSVDLDGAGPGGARGVYVGRGRVLGVGTSIRW